MHTLTFEPLHVHRPPEKGAGPSKPEPWENTEAASLKEYRIVWTINNCSVADPGCLSRIPDPDFYPSRIPDLGSQIQKQQQERGVKKKFLVIPFYEATNFTKL